MSHIIGIAGLGLIGSSLARAFKKYTNHRILGMDASTEVFNTAFSEGVIDGPLLPNLAACDYLILALYPADVIAFLETHKVSAQTVVCDCAGVKSMVCDRVFPIAREKGFAFIGGHPMAGKEFSGYAFGDGMLFTGASMILVPPEDVDCEVLRKLSDLFLSIGFGHIQLSTAAEHDAMIACTSQLAHVVSSAYVKSPSAAKHIGFSAGSFRDMTRVARLNETMWTDLFLANRPALLSEMDGFMQKMQDFRDALEKEDKKRLRTLLREGREIKEYLDDVKDGKKT